MTVRASAAAARVGSRLRFGILLAVGLLLGHDAVYTARFGVGGRLDAAMSALGHDRWWDPFGITALVAAAVLLVGSVLLIRRLGGRLREVGGAMSRTGRPMLGSAYRSEFRALWPRLFLGVVLAFAIQENVESFIAQGDVPGVDVLLGSGFPVAILVLGLVTAILAGLGAVVRWRIHELRQQLGAALAAGRSRHADDRPAREWAAVGAFAPHRWMLDRRDAGRAPPQVLFV